MLYNDTKDIDGDGWSSCTGDCCEESGPDCLVPHLVNPGAIDVLHTDGAWTDDNCDGTKGPPGSCDASYTLTDTNLVHVAGAMELCNLVSSDPLTGPGLVSSKYVRANAPGLVNSQNQVGLQEAFGDYITAPFGSRMLMLSTGPARSPGQPGACSSDKGCSMGLAGMAGADLPQVTDTCAPSSVVRDDFGVQVTLRAPTNAVGFKFRFVYFTNDEYCEQFNDQFVVLVDPPPEGALSGGNIVFDSSERPVSINFSPLATCAACPEGTQMLQGTGFAASTGWLETTAPVTGGAEFTISFVIADLGDDLYDSSVLIDGFEWLTEGPVAVRTATSDGSMSQ